MKPFRIFIFGLSVFSILTLLSVFLPSHINIFKLFTIRIPSFERLISNTKPAYKDISHILRLSNLMKDSILLISDKIPEKRIEFKKKHIIDSTSRLNADSIRALIRPIEFPAGNDSLLYPFFGELSQLSADKKLIRIMHYGDSQIEGDRITSYIRNQLQLKFGGLGIGLFPVVTNNPASNSYVFDVSDNWIRFSPVQNSLESQTGNKFGALINYSRIDKPSNLFGKTKELDAWIDLKRANISFSQAQRFQQCRIFYGFNKTPMMVQVKQNQTIVDAEIVPSSVGLKQLRWRFNNPVHNLSISFKTDESPNVYGIALDGLEGLAVDNIPLRGSAGLEFTRIDLNFLKQFYQLLNVKLLILQFGVNVVPNVIENYTYYENNFLRQIEALKKACPFLTIIVIGVSDVSRNGDNGYESYPNVIKIRDAQKRAAFASGCAFWDMYEAMGGHNSMPSWVYANPPLAQKDFVHLSPIGAKIIGELFYRSFIQEYDRFIKSRNKTVNEE